MIPIATVVTFFFISFLLDPNCYPSIQHSFQIVVSMDGLTTGEFRIQNRQIISTPYPLTKSPNDTRTRSKPISNTKPRDKLIKFIPSILHGYKYPLAQ